MVPAVIWNVLSSDTREMLVVINGTVGVGKTLISNCLADKIAGAMCIEGDSLGFASPENDHVLRVGIDLISTHWKNGVKVIVFDMFFNDPQKLDWFIAQTALEAHVFYLSASEEELANRIRKRARPRAESDILDSKRLRLNQDRMKNRGIEIDTNDKTPEEITEKIKNLIFAN